MRDIKRLFRAPTQDQLGRYIRPTGAAPLDPAKLALDLLEGDERTRLQTPTNGDASLVVTYKRREGAVASVREEHGSDLSVVQLQGARQEGYRITAGGLQWIAAVADSIHGLAAHPESGLARVTMPPIATVEGIEGATEAAEGRYRRFARHLSMQWSDAEQRYIKDVK